MSTMYFPMLKSKRGELVALKNIDSNFKEYLTPILEVHKPVEKNDGSVKCLQEHIKDVAISISKHWHGNYCGIDLQTLLGERNESEQSILLTIFLENSVELITSFVIYTHTNLSLLKAYKSHIDSKASSKLIFIKLEKDDLDDPFDTMKKIQEILAFLSLSKNEVFLLVDFKSIEKNGIDLAIDSLIDLHDQLEFDLWRNVIISASSFPIDMSDISKDSVEKVKRIEWELWNILQNRNEIFSNTNFQYSDYGISHPQKPELDAAMITPVGKIRYTSDKHWIISRGHKFKDDGKEKREDQYRSLARKLMKEKEFIGGHFSWGDKSIEECAKGEGKFGSLEKWVQIDMNHHFTFVIGQLSTTDE